MCGRHFLSSSLLMRVSWPLSLASFLLLPSRRSRERKWAAAAIDSSNASPALTLSFSLLVSGDATTAAAAKASVSGRKARSRVVTGVTRREMNKKQALTCIIRESEGRE